LGLCEHDDNSIAHFTLENLPKILHDVSQVYYIRRSAIEIFVNKSDDFAMSSKTKHEMLSQSTQALDAQL